MTIKQTADALRTVYIDARNTPGNDAGLAVTLFAIDHAEDVKGSASEIIRQTGVQNLRHYDKELNLGVKLAQHVKRK